VPLLFADECVADLVVRELRARGADVTYAKELCPGSPDPDVLRMATEGGRVLITHDLGFGELAVRQAQPAAGVIILSVYALPSGIRERYAAEQVQALGDTVLGQLAVIEPGRVRLRPLPGRAP
jgi:predicted nuclease of predicted toxin-antitoxin system